MIDGERGFVETLLDWSGVSGIISGLALVFWGGRMAQRVEVLESQVKNLTGIPATLARLDERTKSIQDDVSDIKNNFVRKSNAT